MIIPLGPMTLEKWKERKDQMEHSNDSTWPNHTMSSHNKFWKDHISDKYGLGGDTSPQCGGFQHRKKTIASS